MRLSPILLPAVAACPDPAAQAREDAKVKVLGDAMFYWRCEHQVVVRAGKCRQWSEAFERDRASFVAKYGNDPARDRGESTSIKIAAHSATGCGSSSSD